MQSRCGTHEGGDATQCRSLCSLITLLPSAVHKFAHRKASPPAYLFTPAASLRCLVFLLICSTHRFPLSPSDSALSTLHLVPPLSDPLPSFCSAALADPNHTPEPGRERG